jgi:uncharacterized coiled-coil protein SlyX
MTTTTMLVGDIKGMHKSDVDGIGDTFILCTFHSNKTNQWIRRSDIMQNEALAPRLIELEHFNNWDTMQYGGRPKVLSPDAIKKRRRSTTTNHPEDAFTPAESPHHRASYSDSDVQERIVALEIRAFQCKLAIDTLMNTVDEEASDPSNLAQLINDLTCEFSASDDSWR